MVRLELEKLPTNRLEEVVIATEAKYRRILDFAEEAVEELGEETDYELHDSYARSTHKLTDFFGFDFQTDGAFSMFGGRGLRIKYNKSEVLKIEYWDKEKFQVTRVVPGEWMDKLAEYMTQKTALFDKYKSGQTDSTSTATIEHNANVRKRNHLFETAKRLQMTL